MAWLWETLHDCSKHGHRFEGRYDHWSLPDGAHVKGHGDVVEVIKAAQPKTYVRDVCVYCGKTIRRDT